MAELQVWMGDRPAGTLTENVHGALALTYDPRYLERDDAVPISLSIPLHAARHKSSTLKNFLRGFLPDNPRALTALARRFGTSPANTFRLLGHIGHDVAGALRFLHPADHGGSDGKGEAEGSPLTRGSLESLLAEIRSTPDNGLHRAVGRWSLAGAQGKLAVNHVDGAWRLPARDAPSTHILKPSSPAYGNLSLNEFACMRALKDAGVPVPGVDLEHFGPAGWTLVVERYDRILTPSAIMRLHQEDLCQALGIDPELKYQETHPQVSPGVHRVGALIAALPDERARDFSRKVFLDGLLASYLLWNTDAHAKNYSILHTPRMSVMAPLYDVVSWYPYRAAQGTVSAGTSAYSQSPAEGTRLAMHLGGEYRIEGIGPQHWEQVARAVQLEPEYVEKRLARLRSSFIRTFTGLRSHEVEEVRSMATLMLEAVHAHPRVS